VNALDLLKIIFPPSVCVYSVPVHYTRLTLLFVTACKSLLNCVIDLVLLIIHFSTHGTYKALTILQGSCCV
jgi:hypothetical protein